MTLSSLLEDSSFLSHTLGSLSNSVFERRTSTGSGLFASLGSGLVETLGEIVFKREKKLSNTSLLASRNIKKEKASLLVDVRRSKTSLLKVPIVTSQFGDSLFTRVKLIYSILDRLYSVSCTYFLPLFARWGQCPLDYRLLCKFPQLAFLQKEKKNCPI